jgi:large subunit ribosomal protein L24
VRIIRGDRKGTEGKVTEVDQKAHRIFIEGVTREKVDGTTTLVPIHPSKAMITGLNLDDKWRKESLKAAVAEKAEKIEKPEEKPVEEEKKPEEKKPEAPKKERKKKKPRASTAKKTKKVKAEKTEGSESG